MLFYVFLAILLVTQLMNFYSPYIASKGANMLSTLKDHFKNQFINNCFLMPALTLLFLTIGSLFNVVSAQNNNAGGTDEYYPKGDIYVSPNGSDENQGSEASPYKTLDKALGTVTAGKVIYLRGGVYNIRETVIIQQNGSSDALIRLFAYRNEAPVLSFSQMSEDPSNRGVILNADYWHFRGITIEQAGDNGMLLSGNSNKIEKCVFRKNRDSGLQMSRYDTKANNISQWPSNNLILECESYDNCDSDNEDADGFAPKLTCGTGNVFRRCVSHHNIDDGWDLYSKSETGPIGTITLDQCIAHNNGSLTDNKTSGNGDKNGFKLGSSATKTNHIVRRCIAFKNGKHGFTDNGNTSSIEFINNTSWSNGDYNFHTRDGATHVFKNNVSFGGKSNDRIVGNYSAPNALTASKIEWPFTVTSSDFISMIPGPDSNPVSNGFLTPKDGNRLVDAGVAVDGIGFYGNSPDLGAVETGGEDQVYVEKKCNSRISKGKMINVKNSTVTIPCEMSSNGNVFIYITDCIGRTVYSDKSSKKHGIYVSKINTMNWAGGTYYVSIIADKRMSYKFILH